jgi:hypothetical protein
MTILALGSGLTPGSVPDGLNEILDHAVGLRALDQCRRQFEANLTREASGFPSASLVRGGLGKFTS